MEAGEGAITSRAPHAAPGDPPIPRPAGPIQRRGAPVAVASHVAGASAPAMRWPRVVQKRPAGPARRTPSCSVGCTPEGAVAKQRLNFLYAVSHIRRRDTACHASVWLP